MQVFDLLPGVDFAAAAINIFTALAHAVLDQKLKADDKTNCQQLHADFVQAETLPEETPKGGEED